MRVVQALCEQTTVSISGLLCSNPGQGASLHAGTLRKRLMQPIREVLARLGL